MHKLEKGTCDEARKMSSWEANFDGERRLAHFELCLINNHCLDLMLDGDSNINIEARVSNILHCLVYAVSNIYCPVVRSFYSHLIKGFTGSIINYTCFFFDLLTFSLACLTRKPSLLHG